MVSIPAKSIITEPWMTPGLMRSSYSCDKLYKKSIGLSSDGFDHIKYRIYWNKYNKIKREARKQYYKNIVNEYINDSKNLWKILNEVIHK